MWRAAAGLELQELLRGEIEKVGIAPHLSAREPGGRTVINDEFGGAGPGYDDLLRGLFVRLARDHRHGFKAIGHRIVHGGAVFKAPVRIDDQVTETLAKLASLAPLHQPHNLGVALDEHANDGAHMRIAAKASRVAVYVIPTDEERMIAEHTIRSIQSAITHK